MFLTIVLHQYLLMKSIDFPRALFLALCSLYKFPLLAKLLYYGIHFHCYVDNTQLYKHIKADQRNILQLKACSFMAMGP